MSETPPFTAHNGFTLPAVGLGTYALRGQAGSDAVSAAIDAGYRLIDTAFNYENEGVVGRGVAAAGVDPAEIIVTSKLPGRHHPADKARASVEESRARLGLDAIDLHLIHWPNPARDEYVEAWRALIDAQERGVVRQIGVSNFLPEHLERLEAETGIRPVVNQIEIHPAFPQEEAVTYHRERGIITQAWSPLGRAQAIMSDAAIGAIAAAHDASPVDVVLAWHRARGIVAIPKAATPAHQRANLEASRLTLTGDEVASITALGRPDGRLFNGDPNTHEEM